MVTWIKQQRVSTEIDSTQGEDTGTYQQFTKQWIEKGVNSGGLFLFRSMETVLRQYLPHLLMNHDINIEEVI